jgi:hypothetical protein
MLTPNDADLSVALEHRQGDFAQVADVSVQPDVFQHVVFAEAIAPREQLSSVPSRTMDRDREIVAA